MRQLHFERILCPTDFSEGARRAFAHATSLARWCGGELTVVHVAPVDPIAGIDPFAPPSTASSDPALWQRMLRDLEEFVAPARKAGIRLKTALLEGNVVDQVLGLAEALSPDLIVMSVRGPSHSRWRLSSMSEAIRRRVGCPVLTVSDLAGRPAPPGGNPFYRILCPVDLGGTSRETLRFSLALAGESDAAMAVLHVVGKPARSFGLNADLDVPEYRGYMAADARARLQEAVLTERSGGKPVDEIVTMGEPDREIVRVADEREADLIVMGARGANPIDALFLGSTAGYVVHRAPCPVITLPLAAWHHAPADYVTGKNEAQQLDSPS